MNKQHFIDRKVLVDYVMNNYQANWKFHDLLTGISNLPLTEDALYWVPNCKRLPEREGFYECLVFNIDTRQSYEAKTYFNNDEFSIDKKCYVIAWKE